MHVLQLLLQIGAILLAGRLLGLAFRRIGQPAVIAEIVAGICLGPSVLGALSPEALDALFPASSLSVLGMVSQLGLVFFMFLVGLEFDPGLLKGQGRSSVAISNAGIIVPFFLGGLLSILLYPTLAPEGVAALPFGLFMGTSMSVTAFPVLARILAERHLIRTRVGALALAAAAVDDVSAWCLLAAVVAVAGSTGLGAAGLTTLLAALYVATMWFVVRPILARIGPPSGHSGSADPVSTDTVAVVFLLLLGSAAMTEWIGIHALFGAFVFGAIVPRDRGLPGILAEKLEDFVTLVLLPLFLAYSGLRTSIGLLDSLEAWGITLVIIVVATLGKFGGTTAAARLTGIDWRSSAAIGVLMNTRGLMELVVLNIGLDLGVLSKELFAMMVVMALVTTWMTSPLLERILPAAKMIEEEATAPVVPEPTTEPGVLLCVSDPGIAAAMVHLADAWTRKMRGTIWALHLRPVDRFSASLRPDDVRETPLSAVEEAAEALGLSVAPLSFSSAEPGEDVVRIARLKKVPLLIIGVHRSVFRGETPRGETLGGATGVILKGAASDVGVLLERGLGPVRRVGLVRGSGVHGAAAERVAKRLCGDSVEVVSPGAIPAGIDLVVAPFSAEGVPETETSWLLVHGAEA